jgi:hypothetical protein
VTKVTGPGIGIIAFFWLLYQVCWAGGPTVTSRAQLPRVDRQRMLMTGRSWTGRRTLNLAELAQVRRVKWTFSSQYGTSDRVDYVILTDRSGVRLSMRRRTALEPVPWALDHQLQNGLPRARVSRFAAIGLGLAPDDTGFRLQRTLTAAAAASRQAPGPVRARHGVAGCAATSSSASSSRHQSASLSSRPVT